MRDAAEARTVRRRDGAAVAAAALAARIAVVAWAATRVPPAGDGIYYDALARRLAAGLGYTWAWPDGSVTFAAHYPVGYPALVAFAYVVAGPHPWAAMLVNAALGAAGAWATHDLLASAPRRVALAAGLAVALHPALVAYTPALMTEGATAALLSIGLAFAARARPGAVGLALGVATLVRPQSIVLAPAFGLLAGRGRRGRARAMVVASAMALACCAPWTLRNCARMHACALVSVNGGWNLLIGAQSTTGAWAPVDVPPACREVWDEAAKDACFAREARALLTRDLAGHAARAARKLAMTFDYFGAAPWYLHEAAPTAFDARAKVALGALETAAARLLLVLALIAAARAPGARVWPRRALAITGVAFALTEHAWPAYVELALALLARGPAALAEPERRAGGPLGLGTAAAVLATAATHATFFGAGRYGLVVAPLVAGVAALVGLAPRSATAQGAAVDAGQAIAGPGAAPRALRLGREESPSSTECDAG